MYPTRTLFAVDALVYVALALAVLAVFRLNRGVVGLRALVAGHVALALGLLMVGLLREPLPPLLSVVAGNALLVLGVAWCQAGIARLHGRPAPRWAPWLASGGTASALAYLMLVHPSVAARVVLMSSLISAAWLAAAAAALSGWRKPEERLPSGLIVAGVGGLGILHGLRALVGLRGAPSDSILTGAVLTDLVPAADLLGSITWVVGVILLVNQRLQKALADTAERLSSSEAMASALIQHAPDAIVLLDARTGCFASHNAAALRLFGCSAAELSQLGPADLSPELQPDGRPSRQAAQALIDEALAGGTPTFEWMHQRRSGEALPCEVRLLRMPSADGRRLVRGSMLDISERKRSEGERERARLLLEEAQSLAHAGHWTWSVESGRASASPQMLAILGLPSDHAISLDGMAASVCAADREHVEGARRAAGELHRAYDLRYRIERPDGAIRWIDARGRPEPDPSGSTTHVIEVAQDVTERVEMEQSLRRAQISAALGGLVAGAAHEVRNPLFAISATLDAFTARFGRRPEYEHFIHNLRREVDRLTALMQQLLEYGKPPPERRRSGSLTRVAELSRIECASLAASRGVELGVVVEEGVPPIAMDEPSLVRALVNVIQNALHFAPPGSAVIIQVARQSSEASHGWLELSVRDRGPGFPAEEQERIFEPFFTLRPGGTGLGLSIVERIVVAHDGRIKAENVPGGGARVAMAFPILESPDAT